MATAAAKEREREFIIECIQIYRNLPALWNIKSKIYHDREKKNVAYDFLLDKYREMFPDATKDDLKKKFNSLRTNYRKELKKYFNSLKSTPSADSVYEPTLWYFNEMNFLQDQEVSSDSQFSVDTTQNCAMNVDDTEEQSSGWEYDYWAMACAADLRKMDSTQQIYAKKAIAEIIMEGRLGLLHRHSVKINEAVDYEHSDKSPSE